MVPIPPAPPPMDQQQQQQQGPPQTMAQQYPFVPPELLNAYLGATTGMIQPQMNMPMQAMYYPQVANPNQIQQVQQVGPGSWQQYLAQVQAQAQLSRGFFQQPMLPTMPFNLPNLPGFYNNMNGAFVEEMVLGGGGKSKRSIRSAQACEGCRERKVKCFNKNASTPCTRCTERGLACVYGEARFRGPGKAKRGAAADNTTPKGSASGSVSMDGPGAREAFQPEIRQAQVEVKPQAQIPPSFNPSPRTTPIHLDALLAQPQPQRSLPLPALLSPPLTLPDLESSLSSSTEATESQVTSPAPAVENQNANVYMEDYFANYFKLPSAGDEQGAGMGMGMEMDMDMVGMEEGKGEVVVEGAGARTMEGCTQEC